MEDLLPYYERELAFLRRYSREFAARYPKIAARLALAEDHCGDPHAERMIEAFALLTARINKKLEDDYPEFTEALLDALYPHYLRPFPSCTIAQFGVNGAFAHLTEPQVVGRGAELKSNKEQGLACRFRTAYDVRIAPLRIAHARLAPATGVPVVLPAQSAAVFSITFESAATRLGLEAFAPGLPALRAYLHGEQSMVAALLDCFFVHALAAYVEANDKPGAWRALAQLPFAQAGFAPDEALIDDPPVTHPAYRLLTEYFAFPEKFSFVDFDLAAMLRAAGPGRRVTLHIALGNALAEPRLARLVEPVGADQLRLFCTPVANLFRHPAEPVRATHRTTSYPVIADSRQAAAFDIHSIDAVRLVRQSTHGQSITEFVPFHALRHAGAQEDGRYWYARRDDDNARTQPGYETSITLVDRGFDPLAVQTDALSIDLTCTNRDLPTRLKTGLEQGDLFVEGLSLSGRIAILRRPTPSLRFPRGRAAQWRLVSQLALSHVPLAGDGAHTLKEILTLHDWRRDAVSARQIDGIADVEQRAVVEWLPGRPFATFVRGMQIRLTIDEEHFVGTGLATFVRAIDTFLGLYVHLNSFVQLVVVSKSSGEEIIRCKPRSGDSTLV